MKARCELSQPEVLQLGHVIESRLSEVGIPTQPVVAAKILQLAGRAEAVVSDYAKVIRADAALSGRLLKLANSAYFAQRSEVSTIDRASVLLGIDRLRSLSLGFYLSREAATSLGGELSRRVWGEAVYRANLAAELAKAGGCVAPAEAFIVGLMLDAGQPIMGKIFGRAYEAICRDHQTPTALYRAEERLLPYTHVDVVSTMMRRWTMPAALVNAVSGHHSFSLSDDNAPAATLDAIAAYVGSLNVSRHGARPADPHPAAAMRLLKIDPTTLGGIVARAGAEYDACLEIFADVADRAADVDGLVERAHQQVAAAIDRALERSVSRGAGLERFEVCGTLLEVEAATGRTARIFVCDESGRRQMQVQIDPATESVQDLAVSLGLPEDATGEVFTLHNYLKALANV